MSVNIAEAFKTGVNTAVAQMKAFVIPMAIGAIMIGIIIGIAPATKKFLQ